MILTCVPSSDDSRIASSKPFGSRVASALSTVVRVGFDEPVIDDEVRRRAAEVLAETRDPAVELVEDADELAVPRLGELLRLAAPVGHVHVLDPLAGEKLLELRLLLDVALLRADLHAVERRYGDVDVPALDELLHLAVEEGEDERADVRAVDVGVGHDDDPVVAQLLEVELLADARCRSR